MNHATAKSTTDFPSSRELLGLVRERSQKLLPPLAAMNAIRLAESDSSSAAEIASAISTDIRLTTQVLSMANSAAFGARQPMGDIQQAVSRLGVRRIRNVVLASALSGVMNQMPSEVKEASDKINDHGRLTAAVSTKLAGTLALSLQGEEYAAGLVHDVGRLVLFSLLGKSALEVDSLDLDEIEDPTEQEFDMLGTDHTEIGSLMLHTIGFPKTLLDVIRFHHQPERARDNLSLTAVVTLADGISNRLMRDEDPTDLSPRDQHAIAVIASDQKRPTPDILNAIADIDFGEVVATSNE